VSLIPSIRFLIVEASPQNREESKSGAEKKQARESETAHSLFIVIAVEKGARNFRAPFTGITRPLFS